MQVYSMLAANLCMGWIDQLVQDSFAWRTHQFSFAFAVIISVGRLC
jgi:hypothetical protein